jgi:hypothetical protein
VHLLQEDGANGHPSTADVVMKHSTVFHDDAESEEQWDVPPRNSSGNFPPLPKAGPPSRVAQAPTVRFLTPATCPYCALEFESPLELDIHLALAKGHPGSSGRVHPPAHPPSDFRPSARQHKGYLQCTTCESWFFGRDVLELHYSRDCLRWTAHGNSLNV